MAWKKQFASPWICALVAVGILTAALSLRPIHDLDLGFHLRGGQWMLEHHSFHRFDAFTYTVGGHEYVAMYWLFQIGLYLAFKLTGYGGLTVVNALLILLVFYVLFRRTAGGGPGAAACALFPAVLAMELRFGVRPEILTWLLLSLMLWIHEEYGRTGRRILFLLPVIQLVWVNAHGLFILGWAVTAAYAVGFLVHDRQRFKGLLPWSLACILVSFVNPYGARGIAFPFYLLTRLQASNIFRDAITELTPPISAKALFLMPHLPLFLYYAIAGLTVILALATARRRRIPEILIAGSFLYLSLTAVRNIPLFIIAGLPVAARAAQELAGGLRSRFRIPPVLTGRFPAYALAAASLLLAVRVATNAFYAERGAGRFGLGLDPNVHPAGAADFVNRHRLQGRILNDLNHGSWLIWQVRQPVFIDGRLEVMREDFFAEYYRSYASGGLNALIAKYRPDLVVFDHSYPEAALWDIDLKTDPAWRLVYADAVSALWCRRGFADCLPRFDFRDRLAAAGVEPPDGRDAWRIIRKPKPAWWSAWLAGFFRRQENPVGLYRQGLYAALGCDFTSAAAFYLAALDRCRRPPADAWFKLAMVYYLSSDLEKARACFERVLEIDPLNQAARERRDEIRRIEGR